jgi:hypothetical protein
MLWQSLSPINGSAIGRAAAEGGEEGEVRLVVVRREWQWLFQLSEPLRSVPNPPPREKIRRALEKAGVVFIDENGGGPGVRLRKAGRNGR